jgi:hypothetical protein
VKLTPITLFVWLRLSYVIIISGGYLPIAISTSTSPTIAATVAL